MYSVGNSYSFFSPIWTFFFPCGPSVHTEWISGTLLALCFLGWGKGGSSLALGYESTSMLAGAVTPACGKVLGKCPQAQGVFLSLPQLQVQWQAQEVPQKLLED